MVNNQVGGYYQILKGLTFATVRNAGVYVLFVALACYSYCYCSVLCCIALFIVLFRHVPIFISFRTHGSGNSTRKSILYVLILLVQRRTVKLSNMSGDEENSSKFSKK